MPVLVEHLLHRPEEPVGRRGESTDALDGLGDHAGDVTGRGDAEQVAQVGDAGSGELVVREMPERAAQLVAAVDVGDVERGQAGRRP